MPLPGQPQELPGETLFFCRQRLDIIRTCRRLSWSCLVCEIQNPRGSAVLDSSWGRASRHPLRICRQHLRAAQTDLDSEKYSEAVQELRAAIAIHPEIRGAYYQLGFALFQLKSFTEAEKAFKKELDFQPPDPYSLYYLGRIRADAGQRAQAIPLFEKSLDAGEVLDVRERLGSAYLALGQLDGAIRFLQASVEQGRRTAACITCWAGHISRKGGAEAKKEFDAAARWKAKFQNDMIRAFELRHDLRDEQTADAETRVNELSNSNDNDILLASATMLGAGGTPFQALLSRQGDRYECPLFPKHITIWRERLHRHEQSCRCQAGVGKSGGDEADFYEAQFCWAHC